MKERGRRERGAKQSHPFLIKAVGYTSVVLHDNPAKAKHTCTLIYHSKFTRNLGSLPSLIVRTIPASIVTSLDSEPTLSSPLCCSGI